MEHQQQQPYDFVLKPVFNTELPSEELKNKFNSLFDEAYELFHHNNWEESKNASVAFCLHIRKALLEQPILARIIHKDMLHWSLLTVVCEKIYEESTIEHEAIKLLIRMNPYALLWRSEFSDPIRSIAGNCCHCVLLPWIAEHYPWVFEHKRCYNRPPHLKMVSLYANGSLCDATPVRRFYEVFPRGLAQKDAIFGGFPLQHSLHGLEECDSELFVWMAEQYPKAVMRRDNHGFTVLQSACMTLSSDVDPDFADDDDDDGKNMAQICKFLIAKFPRLIWSKARGNRGLPIHYLVRRCNRPLVQQIILLLLREYNYPNESIITPAEKRTYNFLPGLATVPFIKRVHPLLKKEREIIYELELPLRTAKIFSNCTHADGNTAVVKVGELFASWVHLLQTSLAKVRDQIDKTCHAFDGDDVISDEESDGEYEDVVSSNFGDYVDEESDEYEMNEDYDSNSDDGLSY